MYKRQECDKAKEGADGATNAELLVHGAVTCCKSKALDQSVCKVDKCIFGMSKCMILHNDFSPVEDKLTDPKAMEVDENGKSKGDCGTAILNKVEGALCCTAGMKQMSTCVPSEVGDMASCKDTWNNAFEPNFYDKAEAIKSAYAAGGYCVAPPSASPSSGTQSQPVSNTVTASSLGTTAKISSLLPCANAADYDGRSKFEGEQTCDDIVPFVLPATAADCSADIGGTTKAAMLLYSHGKCCKAGSRPNGVCGAVSQPTTTPCLSKAEGEFLPQAK